MLARCRTRESLCDGRLTKRITARGDSHSIRRGCGRVLLRIPPPMPITSSQLDQIRWRSRSNRNNCIRSRSSTSGASPAPLFIAPISILPHKTNGDVEKRSPTPDVTIRRNGGIKSMFQRLTGEMALVLSATIARLLVAAVLGGMIGLERELRHKPAGLRTNMFICFGAAMFTLLSDELAVVHLGDHTRIAAQIIPGIGFIGAGSILHERGSVTGLTTAATLFVVASIGMAVGGGLYLTAVFATALILLALALLGRLEQHLKLRSVVLVYYIAAAAT